MEEIIKDGVLSNTSLSRFELKHYSVRNWVKSTNWSNPLKHFQKKETARFVALQWYGTMSDIMSYGTIEKSNEKQVIPFFNHSDIYSS